MISRCAAEVDAWREVKDGWRPLYGDVDQFGVAVEWHDFRTERSFDWGRSFHPRSLEFCLNLQGHGAVGALGQRQSDYVPGDSGYYAVGDEQLPASRRAHDPAFSLDQALASCTRSSRESVHGLHPATA